MKIKFFTILILFLPLFLYGCQNYKTDNIALRNGFPIGHDLNPNQKDDAELAKNDHGNGVDSYGTQHAYLDASIAY